MTVMRVLFVVSFLVSGLKASDWETITNMNFVTDMAFDGETVWVASTGGLYAYDPGKNSPERFTNVNGLHSVEVSALSMDDHGNLLVGGKAGYIQSFNLGSRSWDMVYLFGDVEINDMVVQGDTLWVATSQGASQFLWNGKKYLFKGFFRNFSVLPNRFTRINYFAGRVWLGTDKGVLTAPGGSNTLEDPQQWKLFDLSNGLPASYINGISIGDNRIWISTPKGLATISRELSVADESAWGTIPADYAIPHADDILVLSLSTDRQTSRIYHYSPGIPPVVQHSLAFEAGFIERDPSGNIWAGLRGNGIMRTDWEKPLRSDGPGQNAIRYILRDGRGYIWASSGKFKLTPNLGFHVYNGEFWTNIDFSGLGWSDLGNTDIIFEDRYGTVWLGSWGGGLIATDGEAFRYFHNYDTEGRMLISTADTSYDVGLFTDDTVYRNYLSSVTGFSREYEIITSIKEDPSGRIWFGNYWPANGNFLASSAFGQDGSIELDPASWFYFGKQDRVDVTREESGISCFEFDDYGRVWIGTFKGGLYLLDYNNTLVTRDDDRVIHLTTNDRLYSNEIRSLTKDLDGIIWIGTTGGLNSSDGVVVNNAINIYRHIGDTGGLAGPLENRINHIAVDKYNNKWISTPAGLSILRSDRSPWDSTGWLGYTTENSGLVDNQVHAVSVDNRTSEAYIATEKGISVFSGSFAEIKEDFSQIAGGPNPFIMDGSGQYFVIRRLRQNSTVKILNINGILVRELTNANGLVSGSRAVWDGKDRNGDEVATGIYLFLAYTEDGSSKAGKIAVIRK